MTEISVSFASPGAVTLDGAPGLQVGFAAPGPVMLVGGPELRLAFPAPQPVTLVAAPELRLVFPAPAPVVLSAVGVQGPPGSGGGGGGADSFETVAKNLAGIDNTGDQISPTTLVVTYANGIIKTIVDSGSTVTVTLSGAVPGGIDLVKTITLTGDDFAIAYS